jgi:putative hydrolase
VSPRRATAGNAPPVAELLDIDREYRAAVASDRLPKVAPRRFNAERRAWLPILHTSRDERHYTALFSNTARAHRLGRTDDWVVIYSDHGTADGQWTVTTSRDGALRGRRIVRGREDECARHYGLAAA